MPSLQAIGLYSTPVGPCRSGTEGCYAFSPSPETGASSYTSVMDRMDDFKCEVPTKNSRTPHRLFISATRDTPDAPSACDNMPHCAVEQPPQVQSFQAQPVYSNPTIRNISQNVGLQAASGERRLMRAAPAPALYLHQDKDTTSIPMEMDATSPWLHKSPPSLIQAGESLLPHGYAGGVQRSYHHEGDALLIGAESAFERQRSPSSVGVSHTRIVASVVASSTRTAVEGQREGSDVALLRSHLNALLEQQSSTSISASTSPRKDGTQSNTPTVKGPSSNGLPQRHRMCSDPAAHCNSEWPCQPPLGPALLLDSFVEVQREPSPEATVPPQGKPSTRTLSLQHARQIPPQLNADASLRTHVTMHPSQPQPSPSSTERPGNSVHGSRVRQDVRRARAQQAFGYEATEFAQQLEERLSSVFALMRRVMVLDARLDAGVDPVENTSTTLTSVDDSMEYRELLVRQLEESEEATMSVVLHFVQCTNRQALEKMNEGKFSAALQLLQKADGLLRRDAGRVFRYLLDPGELEMSRDGGAVGLLSARPSPMARPLKYGSIETFSLGSSHTPKRSEMTTRNLSAASLNHLSSSDSHVRSINVPLFPPSREAQRRQAAAAVEHNLGIYHFKLGEYELAATRFLRVAAVEEELQAPGIGITYFNMAQTQYGLRRMKEVFRFVELAEEAIERQIFMTKDHATLMQRRLAQGRAFTPADKVEAVHHINGDQEVHKLDKLSLLALSAPSGCIDNQTGSRDAGGGGVVSQAVSNSPKEELARLWLQWRESVSFMSHVKQTHAEWLSEANEHKAAYQQLEQSRRWLLSIPNLAPEEKRRLLFLKQETLKMKRCWRREEVELELYHHPLRRPASSHAAAAVVPVLYPPASSLYAGAPGINPTRARSHRPLRSSSPSAAAAPAKKFTAPLQSKIVTSLFPRHVKVVGSHHRRPSATRDAANHPSKPNGRSPEPKAAHLRRRPSSASAVLRSVYGTRNPSPPKQIPRRSSNASRSSATFAKSEGLSQMNQSPPGDTEQHHRNLPSWDALARRSAPLPEGPTTPRSSSESNAQAARKPSHHCHTATSIREVASGKDAVRQASVTEASNLAATGPSDCSNGASFAPHTPLSSHGVATSGRKSVARSLLFEADTASLHMLPGCATCPSSFIEPSLTVETHNSSVGTPCQEERDFPQGKWARREVHMRKDDVDSIIAPSSTARTPYGRSPSSFRTPGDLTWCITIVQAFLRSGLTSTHKHDRNWSLHQSYRRVETKTSSSTLLARSALKVADSRESQTLTKAAYIDDWMFTRILPMEKPAGLGLPNAMGVSQTTTQDRTGPSVTLGRSRSSHLDVALPFTKCFHLGTASTFGQSAVQPSGHGMDGAKSPSSTHGGEVAAIRSPEAPCEDVSRRRDHGASAVLSGHVYCSEAAVAPTMGTGCLAPYERVSKDFGVKKTVETGSPHRDEMTSDSEKTPTVSHILAPESGMEGAQGYLLEGIPVAPSCSSEAVFSGENKMGREDARRNNSDEEIAALETVLVSMDSARVSRAPAVVSSTLPSEDASFVVVSSSTSNQGHDNISESHGTTDVSELHMKSPEGLNPKETLLINAGQTTNSMGVDVDLAEDEKGEQNGDSPALRYQMTDIQKGCAALAAVTGESPESSTSKTQKIERHRLLASAMTVDAPPVVSPADAAWQCDANSTGTGALISAAFDSVRPVLLSQATSLAKYPMSRFDSGRVRVNHRDASVRACSQDLSTPPKPADGEGEQREEGSVGHTSAVKTEIDVHRPPATAVASQLSQPSNATETKHIPLSGSAIGAVHAAALFTTAGDATKTVEVLGEGNPSMLCVTGRTATTSAAKTASIQEDGGRVGESAERLNNTDKMEDQDDAPSVHGGKKSHGAHDPHLLQKDADTPFSTAARSNTAPPHSSVQSSQCHRHSQEPSGKDFFGTTERQPQGRSRVTALSHEATDGVHESSLNTSSPLSFSSGTHALVHPADALPRSMEGGQKQSTDFIPPEVTNTSTGHAAEKAGRTPHPPTASTPKRSRVFLFASHKASAPISESTPTADAPQRSGDSGAVAHAHFASSGPSVVNSANEVVGSDAAKSQLLGVVTRTSGSLDAPLSFNDTCFAAMQLEPFLNAVDYNAGRRTFSAESTNTHFTLFCESLWRSLDELNELRISDDGKLISAQLLAKVGTAGVVENVAFGSLTEAVSSCAVSTDREAVPHKNSEREKLETVEGGRQQPESIEKVPLHPASTQKKEKNTSSASETVGGGTSEQYSQRARQGSSVRFSSLVFPGPTDVKEERRCTTPASREMNKPSDESTVKSSAPSLPLASFDSRAVAQQIVTARADSPRLSDVPFPFTEDLHASHEVFHNSDGAVQQARGDSTTPEPAVSVVDMKENDEIEEPTVEKREAGSPSASHSQHFLGTSSSPMRRHMDASQRAPLSHSRTGFSGRNESVRNVVEADEMQRGFIRQQIMEEEAATMIQQMWRDHFASRMRPEGSYMVW